MRRIILLSILAVCFGVFVFINQKEGGIFKKGPPDLEGFYKLTQEDPLFYSPFFDSDGFEKAIEGLKESENQLKEVIIKNIEATGFRKNDYMPILKEGQLFPYQFLENLISINQKTEEFLQNPSVDRGEELLALYDVAADSYVEDISSKIKIFEKIELYLPQPYFYSFADSISSFETVKNDFLTIKENGDKLKEEAVKRNNCLSGKEDCEALLKTKDNSVFIDSLNADFDLTGEKIDFIKNNLPYSPQEKVRGPYKIKSFCWQNPDFEHWMYLIYSKQDGKNLVIPKLVNQNYYREVPAGATDAINKAFLEKGLKFYFQTEATTYECTDLTFFPQILTLDFLKEQMANGSITGENLEKKLDYKLLIENQFGPMAPVIDTISSYLDVLKLSQMISSYFIVPPEFLFPIRTAYSIFYFPFAKSIWRIDKQPEYFVPEEKRPLTGPSKFKTLDELEKLGYTEEEIKNFNVNQTELLRSVLKNKP